MSDQENKISRREFLKRTGGGLAALFLGGSLVPPDQRIGAAPNVNPAFKKTLPGSEIVTDPFNNLGQPLNLADEPGVADFMARMTDGNEGLVSYKSFMEDLTNAQTLFLSEPHLDAWDKTATREIVMNLRASQPNKEFVFVLGRFTSEDNNSLEKFLSSPTSDSEDAALAELVKETGLQEKWGASFLPHKAGEDYGNLLKLLRRLAHEKPGSIKTFGLGVDSAALPQELDTQYKRNPNDLAVDIAARENRAADIIRQLERDYPEAIIIAHAGNSHMQSGENKLGVPPKLKDLHSTYNLPDRRTLAINFQLHTLGDGGFYEDLRDIVGTEKLTNAVIVVKKPHLAQRTWLPIEQWHDKTHPKAASVYPGFDYLVARAQYNVS